MMNNKRKTRKKKAAKLWLKMRAKHWYFLMFSMKKKEKRLNFPSFLFHQSFICFFFLFFSRHQTFIYIYLTFG